MNPLRSRRFLVTVVATLLVAPLVALAAPSLASEADPVLARVNGESITLEDLYRELEGFHRSVEDPHGTVQMPKLGSLLERLISVRLIIQEARNIGLDEQPEYLEAMDGYRKGALRRLVLDQQIGEVTPPPEAVAEIHERLVKRYRIRGALIESKEEADTLHRRAAEGEEFAALLDDLVERKQGKPTDPEILYSQDELFPEVVVELEKLQAGEVTPVTPVRHIFAVVQLIEIERLDDPVLLEMAEGEAKRVMSEEKKQAFIATLSERYTKTDRELLDSLDVDSEAETFEALKADTRPLVTVAGAAPITVGDLCSALEKQFFHGIERASEGAKLSQRKERVLHELVSARVTLREAERREIEKTEEFARLVDDYAKGLLFSMFVQRVIEPEVDVTEDDLEAYVKRHEDEFTSPEMIQLDALIFEDEASARRALDRLNRGADLDWSRANASGQVDPGQADVIRFNPAMPLVVSELPSGVADAVSGASAGDYRFASLKTGGPFYVLSVRKVIPAERQPLETVTKRIWNPVFAENRQRAIEVWTEQLREVSEVEVIVDGPQLAELVGFGGTR